ncbi:helix-turn-helix domain-containing protein [Actinoalloteichus sp. GBA129-24]|uniref:helix-turn-helix domain-containing protein n=1 Tax=Actinoalloteichus sp. GBA129-24 TaxID=1612551 RepID=UPI000950AEF9|nr:helix-turn-helix transcriptional regulator [Actinoalloteichus sp. GBA129-24]APU22929.1 DNA binding protein with helix-turn-helix domain [Actinoalloteichus sp. GBA129-24]
MARETDAIRELKRTLGRTLADHRRAAGLSQREIAHRVHYTRTAVSHAEAGRHLPTRQFWSDADDAVGAEGALLDHFDRLRTAIGESDRAEREHEQAAFRSRAQRGHAALAEDTGGTVTDLNASPDDQAQELAAALHSARRVGPDVVALFAAQLAQIRTLDRRLGAGLLRDEVRAKIAQIEPLMRHSVDPAIRRSLATVLTEYCTLAGWQCLDGGLLGEAWQHYENAKAAARESGNAALFAHVIAEQAFVLIDIGRTADAGEVTGHALAAARQSAPTILLAWLAAAHGEALAADDQSAQSLRAFDRAARALPADTVHAETPYVAMNDVHLTRWRGHALARCGERSAVTVLSDALQALDPSFTRAETALRVDLTHALLHAGERDSAVEQATQARTLARQVGSTRQQRRLARLALSG